MKRYVWYMLGLVLSSLGNTLMVKMMLGQSTFNAMIYNVSLLTHLKIGYISIMFNICVMLIQIIILNKNFKKIQLLQMVPGIICGVILNFFIYDYPLTSNLEINQYMLEIFVFISGLLINAFGISLITTAHIVAAPIETLCLILSEKTRYSFRIYRTGFDVFFITVAIIVMVIMGKNTYTIREGTLINLLFMGTLIGFFNQLCIRYIYADTKNCEY